MSIDSTNTGDNSDMFGAPIWERSAKKKMSFGKSRKTNTTAGPVERPMESPTHTPLTADAVATRPVTRPMTAPMTAQTRRVETIVPPEAVATEAPMFAAPIQRRTTTRKTSNTVPTGALVAGAVAVVAIGAGAWYALQPRGSDLQMETNPETSIAALEAAPPSSLTTGPATNTMTPPVTAPAAAPAATPTPQRTAEIRTRPAQIAAASAEEAGVNTSANLPEGPQPYASLNGGDGVGAAATAAEPMRITPPAPAATPAPAASPTTANPAPTMITPPAPATTSAPPL